MNTSFEIEYALKDLTAIEDSLPSTTDNQTFADILLLKEGVSMKKYMTFEDDFTLLDGTFEEMPDVPDDVSFWSDLVSDEDGLFVENPLVEIAFDDPHSSIGLTLYFAKEVPHEFKITWLNESNTIISQKTYNVENIIESTGACIKYFASNQVSNYYRVKIEFIRTIPYHFIKMCYLEYGADVLYSEDTIKKAILTEETNANSEKISVNTIDIDIIDKAGDFNLGNANGLHASLQQQQYLKAYEWLDNVRTYLGKYYLSNFYTTDNVTRMTCISIVGIMDNFSFVDGGVYNGTLAGVVIDLIMDTCGITDYTVDTETTNTPLYGTLGKMTCREAIREVLFATNSHLKTARLDSIEIKKENRSITSTIDRDRKFTTKAEKREYVSSVEVKYKKLTLDAATSEIVKDTYPAGVSVIEFTSPVGTIAASVGTILVQKPYYCIIDLVAQSEVTITGYKYNIAEFTVTKSVPVLKVGEIEKVKSFSTSLMNYQSASDLCDKLLEYYSRPLKVSSRFVNLGEQSGLYTLVKNPNTSYNDYVAGIEKMSTDLTGGFISSIEAVGYYDAGTEKRYAGEFYAGERW